ncbi:MAG TPA: hypothetical protein VFV38_18810 [Ktedonobacteraceae bacterium]|nr:hypothetical protein [Ktedonobacteraceae bacterium]
MAEKDDFFSAQEIDQQIERVSQFQEGDALDAEAMAYLRSFYRADSKHEQEVLDRIWNRITDTSLFESNTQTGEKEQVMHNSPHSPHMPYDAGTLESFRGSHPRRSSLMRRLGTLAAVVFLVILVGSMAMVFYAVRQTPGGTGSSPQQTPPIPTTAHVPLQVTSVDMSVAPKSIAGIPCGTHVTVTYTALFHANPHSAGGTVQFTYTVNNGRGQTPASITFNPGQTTRVYTFTWSGALPLDHTSPGQGGVQVSSPNQLTSALVAPDGQCTATSFQVTKIEMAVSPASIQGMSCGSSLVVSYTATIHVTPNSSGGTVQFTYTINNGRGQTPASITFSPGQTTKTYTFTWSGMLPADHTYPGPGGIQVTSPDQITSALVAPTGMCS